MRIISRSEWDAQYGDGRYVRSLPCSEAWLHHSVTIAPDLEPPYDDDFNTIRHIEEVGKNRFGSIYGFPYTFGITPVGKIFAGHAINKTGAHTANHNTVAIGIVFVGNYENSKPTEEQLKACAWLLVECKHRGWLKTAQLTGGHRDVKATACPGQYAYREIDTINQYARERDFDVALSDSDKQLIKSAARNEPWKRTFKKANTKADDPNNRISTLGALRWSLERSDQAVNLAREILEMLAELDATLEPRVQDALAAVAAEEVKLTLAIEEVEPDEEPTE